MAVKIAVVGLGKIAQDQHLPAIAASEAWELAATVSASTSVEGVENFSTLAELLEARADIPVISLCVPPAPRFDLAVAALEADRHLMLEKPPGATITECTLLQQMAEARGLTLFTTWHSREAHQVDLARDWLSDKQISDFEIIWREDVRRWHPGQQWIWEPGGMGVLDPGINALSILTKILPTAVRVTAAELSFPQNCQTPIAVSMQMRGNNGEVGKINFDWRQQGDQIWEIRVTTNAGTLELKDGGAMLLLEGVEQPGNLAKGEPDGEYPRLYSTMHGLVVNHRSNVDLRPHLLIADALMLGARLTVEPFEF